MASKQRQNVSNSEYGSPAYRWYVVAVLALVYACHALDRGLPSILVEPVRQEFHLSDSQLGLFSGLAFGVAYAVAGLPMGIMSDKVPNRRNALVAVVMLWSLITALAGWAKTFGQLLFLRAGLGVAEAGTGPLTVPMLSDLFPPERRAFVLGIFYTSQPVGGLLAAALGGFVAETWGWRTAFIVAGIPGAVAALLLLATVRDPPRGGTDSEAPRTTEKTGAGMRAALAHLTKTPGLIYLILGCAVLGLLNITLGAWMASFFIRVHGLSLTQTGLILGVAAAVCSIVSPPLFGWLSDRLVVRDARWPLRLIWMAGLGSMALTLTQLFTPLLGLAIVCFVIADVLRVGYTPPTYSVLLARTPASMRGSMISIVQILTSAIGFGAGPILTGALSDAFGGGAAIRYAMAIVSTLFLLAALLLMIASRSIYAEPARIAADG